MTDLLTVDVAQADDGSAVVTLGGEFDLSQVEHFHAAVRDVVRDGVTEVVVDMRGLRFIDSSGLRALLQLHADSLERGYRLILRSPLQDAVRKLMDLTLLSEKLPFEPNWQPTLGAAE